MVFGDYAKFGEYAKILGRGLMSQMAPTVLKGALVEFLRTVTIKEASQWVIDDTSLWDRLGPERQEGLKIMAQEAGGLDWMSAEWVIDAIREDCPALASLFLGWRKSRNWLVRQVVVIQTEVKV